MTTQAKLEALAANLWWSWNPDTQDLFRRLNPDTFHQAKNNPIVALRNADPDILADEQYAQDVDQVYQVFQAYLTGPRPLGDAPKTSYFCMEYGLHESLALYSGGLGVLAGDHVKATSDLGVPFTAIGLYLRDGYFKQRFDAQGWQHADYPVLNPEDHPLTLITDDQGKEIIVTVHLGTQPLALRAWRLDVGRTPLYLLDSDVETNSTSLRSLTHKLYQGDRKTRIQQEIILGIGGIRLLRALDIETEVYHLNEGHCAFLTLELLRERLDAGDTRSQAEAWVREQAVFTTHTPVPAGHDRFVPALFNDQMAGFREQLGLTISDLLAYGRVDEKDANEAFTMTVLGLKLSRKANGVAALNGVVARRQWHYMYADRDVEEVPISHITNGIHLPTWAAPEAHRFLNVHLGDWRTLALRPGYLANLRRSL